jgi:hypothetical protein
VRREHEEAEQKVKENEAEKEAEALRKEVSNLARQIVEHHQLNVTSDKDMITVEDVEDITLCQWKALNSIVEQISRRWAAYGDVVSVEEVEDVALECLYNSENEEMRSEAGSEWDVVSKGTKAGPN